MGVARLWFGAELRQRWRQQVALALLVGFVGAAVLTCVAAARRTDSTYRRYLSAQAVPQLEAWSGPDPSKVPAMLRSIAAIPAVRATASYDTFFGAPLRKGVLPGQDFVILAAADDEYSRTFDRPIVVDGRLPNPNAPDEVFVNERAAKALQLHVGTKTRLRSFAADQADALQSGIFNHLKFVGPEPTVRVVGIGRSRVDLVTASYAQRYFIASHAFYARYVGKMFGFGQLIDIRVDPGANLGDVANAVARRIAKDPQTVDVSRLTDAAKGIKGATRVQALALVLVALIALAAGVVATSQAIGRSVNASAPDHSTLAALGVDRARRVRLTVVTFLPAATGAAALAVTGAWVASRWFPTGVARQAEVRTGAQFDVR
ncbi:MAG: putative transport system permease protein, partial [Actinomycetota bacterium]|nr:putative transport system permease protein [Actinomycetota bacterium]